MAKRPNIRTQKGLEQRLKKEPREVAVAVAARTTLRALPFLDRVCERLEQAAAERLVLAVFRGACIGRLSTLATPGFTSAAASAAASNADQAAADFYFSDKAKYSAYAGSAARTARAAGTAGAAATHAFVADSVAAAASYVSTPNLIWDLASSDIARMQHTSAKHLVEAPLWEDPEIPRTYESAWNRGRKSLLGHGFHWQVWIDWYEDILHGRPPWGLPPQSGNKVSLDFLTWPEEKWKREPKEINQEIAALIEAETTKLATGGVPEQQIAPVQVEERDGKIAKVLDRDSPLSAPERDFEQWRAPVASHLDELLAGDFRPGTNHARMRARLTELQAHLQGSIADVKENQFRLGYGMTRFASLVSAYETGGDDMPVLSPDTLKDLIVLDAGLRMGLDKLERWVAFREAAASDRSGAADAPAGEVAKVLDSMAGTMEKNEKFFDPELPLSLRWLAETLKDAGSAAKIHVYGAYQSAKNAFIWLGQRALGLTKAAFEGAEKGVAKGIEKGTAAGLFILLSGAGLHLSGLAPGALSWIKPVLEAIQKIAL